MTVRFTGSQAAADADSNFPVAPKGTVCWMEVVKDGAKEGMTKGNPAKGTPQRPMMELELVVSSGEYKDKVRVWHYLTFIEPGGKGHGMTLHALHAFGFETEGENEYSADQFEGRGVKVELGIDTYQGKRKNKINKFLVEDEDTRTDRLADEAAAKGGQSGEEETPPWVEEGQPIGAAAKGGQSGEEETPPWVEEGQPIGAAAKAPPASPKKAPAPVATPAGKRKRPW